MFITIMTGTRKKKFSLNTPKEKFVASLIFDSVEEKESCERYLETKGVQYHIVLANYVGLNKEGKIPYKSISSLYKYDKRIRNILYKFFSAFEEGIRAYICNRYSNRVNRKMFGLKIHKNIHEGSSLSKELENLKMGELIKLSLKLPEDELMQLYGNTDKLSVNLKSARELRNIISHHRMLFVYEEYEPCFIDDKEDDSLKANIINLHRLLNVHHKESFRNEINCAYINEGIPIITEKDRIQF